MHRLQEDMYRVSFYTQAGTVSLKKTFTSFSALKFWAMKEFPDNAVDIKRIDNALDLADYIVDINPPWIDVDII